MANDKRISNDQLIKLGRAFLEARFRGVAERQPKTAARQDLEATYQAAMNALQAKDVSLAGRLMSQAAEAGHIEAQYVMGVAYADGWFGLKTDIRMGELWMSKARASGHPFAGDLMAAVQREREGIARAQRGRTEPTSPGSLTRAEALEIFDLKEGATEQDIRAAYTRLIQQVHPDKGGSTFFAKQLNAARQRLLQ